MTLLSFVDESLLTKSHVAHHQELIQLLQHVTQRLVCILYSISVTE